MTQPGRPAPDGEVPDRDSPGVLRMNLSGLCGSAIGDVYVALDRQHLDVVVSFLLLISSSNFWYQCFVTLSRNSFVEPVMNRAVG